MVILVKIHDDSGQDGAHEPAAAQQLGQILPVQPHQHPRCFSGSGLCGLATPFRLGQIAPVLGLINISGACLGAHQTAKASCFCPLQLRKNLPRQHHHFQALGVRQSRLAGLGSTHLPPLATLFGSRQRTLSRAGPVSSAVKGLIMHAARMKKMTGLLLAVSESSAPP